MVEANTGRSSMGLEKPKKIGIIGSLMVKSHELQLRVAVKMSPDRREKRLRFLIRQAEGNMKRARRQPGLECWFNNFIGICHLELGEPSEALAHMQAALFLHTDPRNNPDSSFPGYVDNYTVAVERLLEKAVPTVQGNRKVESIGDLELAVTSMREVLGRHPRLRSVRLIHKATKAWLKPDNKSPTDSSRPKQEQGMNYIVLQKRLEVGNVPIPDDVKSHFRKDPEPTNLNDQETRQIVHQLQILLPEITRIGGKKPSRPCLTASYIETGIQHSCVIEAYRALQRGDGPGLVVNCDLSSGMLHLVNCLYWAEEQIAGGTDRKFMDRLHAVPDEIKSGVDPGLTADIYLRLQKNVKAYTELLKADPSGFELMRTAVRDLEKEDFSSIPELSFHDKDIFIHGARLALDTYIATYPLTAQFYP